MLDQISDNADFIIAGVQTALTLDMLPTIWTQFRARASTVPLTSSLPTAVGLAVLGLVFFSTGLFIATGTVVVGSAMWWIVAAQRVRYNRGNESASQTFDADSELCSDGSGVSGPGPVYDWTKRDGCGCVHFTRAGWCWHRNSPPGGGQRQATGVGVDGDSQGNASSVKAVPDLFYDSLAADPNGDWGSVELEEEA